MNIAKISAVAVAATVLAGCAAKQDVSRFEAEKPKPCVLQSIKR